MTPRLLDYIPVSKSVKHIRLGIDYVITVLQQNGLIFLEQETLKRKCKAVYTSLTFIDKL